MSTPVRITTYEGRALTTFYAGHDPVDARESRVKWSRWPNRRELRAGREQIKFERRYERRRLAYAWDDGCAVGADPSASTRAIYENPWRDGEAGLAVEE